MQIFFTKKPDSIRHNGRKRKGRRTNGRKGKGRAIKLPWNYQERKKRRGGGTIGIEEDGGKNATERNNEGNNDGNNDGTRKNAELTEEGKANGEGGKGGQTKGEKLSLRLENWKMKICNKWEMKICNKTKKYGKNARALAYVKKK